MNKSVIFGFAGLVFGFAGGVTFSQLFDFDFDFAAVQPPVELVPVGRVLVGEPVVVAVVAEGLAVSSVEVVEGVVDRVAPCVEPVQVQVNERVLAVVEVVKERVDIQGKVVAEVGGAVSEVVGLA